MISPDYPRDLIGYGRTPPQANWPGRARVAVQFVLNYEEGGENSILHGDSHSEQFLSEIAGAEAYPARHLSMESIYEYGSRAGVWRVLREFERRGLPLTIFGVAMALERNPEVAQAFRELGHEIACHGYRWIHYQNVPEAVEREHLERALAIFQSLYGELPLGWYTGRDSPNTRRLLLGCRPRTARARRISILSSPTRWTPTTCALPRRPASITASRSSNICEMPSTCSTKKARKRRRCCRSACIAAWSAAPAASARCSASSITSKRTTGCG